MKTSTERKILPYKKGSESHLPVRRAEIESYGLLRQEIDRLFDDFTRGFRGFLEPFRLFEERTRQFSPVVGMLESEKDVTVNVELPGIDEKDIEISLRDGQLMIGGKKKEEKEETGKGYYRTERSFGEFCRVIPVPSEIDTEKVSAVYKKGLLSITMPKTEEAKAKVKKIAIKAG